MLSVLPKIADRNFILAFIVPSLLFVVALLFLFQGSAAGVVRLQALFSTDFGTVAYYAAMVWLLSILLAAANYWIYRMLEGYLPPFKWLKWREARYRSQVNDMRRDLKDLYSELKANRLAGGTNSPEDIKRYRLLYRKAMTMPPRPGDVKPTSFGNAIKCFETYAPDVYGADTVVLWPRLLPVVSKEYAAAVEAAHSQVDFAVNCSLLSGAIALISLGFFFQKSSWLGAWDATFALKTHPPEDLHTTISDIRLILSQLSLASLAWFASAAVASRLMYKAAVVSIPAWGSLVMAGFDCYLPELAKKLGFDLPKTDSKRRQFWKEFGEQAYYRLRPDGSPIFQTERWLFPRRR